MHQEPKLKIFATWHTEDSDGSYWELFDDIKSAVLSSAESEIEVFELTAKSVGIWEMSPTKARKKRLEK